MRTSVLIGGLVLFCVSGASAFEMGGAGVGFKQQPSEAPIPEFTLNPKPGSEEKSELPKDPVWDAFKESVEDLPIKSHKGPKFEIFNKEEVFKGTDANAENCLYATEIPNRRGTQPLLAFDRAGYSTDKDKQQLTHHCLSKNLVRVELKARELMCEENHLYIVLDRSGSMNRFDGQVMTMMAKLLEISRRSRGRIVVGTSDPTAGLLYDSREAREPMTWSEFSVLLASAKMGPREEQGFLSAINLLSKKPFDGKRGSCLHLVFFADEAEQSEVPMSADKFLKKVSGLCGECRRVLVHSAFPEKCSAYQKAAELSGGLVVHYADESHFEALGRLMDTDYALPFTLPTPAQNLMSVTIGSQHDDRMPGKGDRWGFEDARNQAVYGKRRGLSEHDTLQILYTEKNSRPSGCVVDGVP